MTLLRKVKMYFISRQKMKSRLKKGILAFFSVIMQTIIYILALFALSLVVMNVEMRALAVRRKG